MVSIYLLFLTLVPEDFNSFLFTDPFLAGWKYEVRYQQTCRPDFDLTRERPL